MDIIKIIDEQIKELWKNDIFSDYNNCRLLKEDCLKNAFYYHLRRRLGEVFLDEHNLQIYTELDCGPLKGTKKRADLAIVSINYDDDENHLGECVDKIFVIIELKYKTSQVAVDAIISDVNKIRSYIQDDKIDCKYYLGAIGELEGSQGSYLDSADANWATGKLTELIATYDQDAEMVFTVHEH